MLRILLVTAAVVALAGCVLRPRYQDLLATTSDGDFIDLLVVDPTNNAPIAGANVTVGEGKDRFAATSDANGMIELPRDARLEKANPMVIVELPAGHAGYAFVSAPPRGSSGMPPAAAPGPVSEGQAPPSRAGDDSSGTTAGGRVGPGQPPMNNSDLPPGHGSSPQQASPSNGDSNGNTPSNTADAGTR